MSRVMIYGAETYLGRSLSNFFLSRQVSTIIASQDSQKILALSRELQLECKAFPPGTHNAEHFLAGVRVLINCAEPYRESQAPLLKACCASGTHYIDFAREAESLEHAFLGHEQWVKNGICVLSGLNIENIILDYVAKLLKQALPDCTSLDMGYSFYFSPSLQERNSEQWQSFYPLKGLAARNGPLTLKTILIPLQQGPLLALQNLPKNHRVFWFSTRIPHIRSLLFVTRSQLSFIKFLCFFRFILSMPLIGSWLKKQIQTLYPLFFPEESHELTIWAQGQSSHEQTLAFSAKVKEPGELQLVVLGLIVELLLDSKENKGAFTPLQMFKEPLQQLEDSISLVQEKYHPGFTLDSKS